MCLWVHPDREAWLASMPVGDVRGVGRRWGSVRWAWRRRRTGRRLPRTCSAAGSTWSWRGRRWSCAACLGLDDAPVTRQTLVRSRSFGEPTGDLAVLSRAVATHAARAAEKLRAEGLAAGRITAFVTTKGFEHGPHRPCGADEALDEATSDSTPLVAAARRCLGRAYAAADGRGRPYRYRKAGVTVYEIRPEGTEQRGPFPIHEARTVADRERRRALMEALDAATRRFGKRAVVVASQGCPSTLARARAAPPHPGWGRAAKF